MMKRDAILFIEDIIESIGWIENFIENMTFSEFIADEKTKTAVIKKLEVVGEAAKNIPDGIKKEYKGLPWKKMAGMRDKLSHEYFGVRHEIVWKVAKETLPGIKPEIEKLLEVLRKRTG
jgi:uncharacterized protein with HEPN domain